MTKLCNFSFETFPYRTNYKLETSLMINVHRCGAGGSLRACHAAGPGSIPGRDKFAGWGFLGVFLHVQGKCQEVLGPQGPRISFGRHNHPFIFALLELMCAWLMCLVKWPRHWADPLSGEVLHVLVWSKKYVSDRKLIPSPVKSWLCKARAAWVT